MTTTSSTQAKLTDGQQGVIAMYDKYIAHAKRERDLYEKFGNDQETYRMDDLIAELEDERDYTLEQFQTEPVPVVAPEPQAADYQAAVDNVWFEIEQSARSIKSTWTFDLWNARMDRMDYVSDMEEQITQAVSN